MPEPVLVRLRLEVRATPRVIPRLLTLVTGRTFRIVGCDYRDVSDGRGRMQLDLQGPSPRNLLARLASLPDVLEVTDLDDAAEAPPPPFTVLRARCSTRVASDLVFTEAAVALQRGDTEVLAAGEGSGPVEALAAAFADGVQRLSDGEVAAVEVDDVVLAVNQPAAGLTAEVEVTLTGQIPGRAVTARAAAGDLVQAAVGALSALYARAAHEKARATVSATA